MSKKLTKKAISTFESIKEVDINGNEYWNSRKLAKVLEYADYRNFITVVGKAKEDLSRYKGSDFFVIDNVLCILFLNYVNLFLFAVFFVSLQYI